MPAGRRYLARRAVYAVLILIATTFVFHLVAIAALKVSMSSIQESEPRPIIPESYSHCPTVK